MGVFRLWKLLGPFRQPFSGQFRNPRVVAVDALNVLCAYSSTYGESFNYHIAGLYRLTVKLLKLGLIPLFVFDSPTPNQLKMRTKEYRMARSMSLSDVQQLTTEELRTIFREKDDFQIFKQADSSSRDEL